MYCTVCTVRLAGLILSHAHELKEALPSKCTVHTLCLYGDTVRLPASVGVRDRRQHRAGGGEAVDIHPYKLTFLS